MTSTISLRTFSLQVPLLSEGNTHTLLAATDSLWLHIKVYAAGGENGLHAHPNEDHAFVVLDGEATFFDDAGHATVVEKYGGVMVPRGALYRFHSTGPGNLVLLRVGGSEVAGDARALRTGPGGELATGHDPSNKTGAVPGVPISGRFFGSEPVGA